MERIKRQLERLTGRVLACSDPEGEEGMALASEIELFQVLAATHALFEKGMPADRRVRERLDEITAAVLKSRGDGEGFDADSYIADLKGLQRLMKAWAAADGIEVRDEQWERDRKSSKQWDVEGGLTTTISLTAKQTEALAYLDAGLYDNFLAVGGSGSGKSFIEAYKVIRDSLRHRAPCLIGRDKLIDLRTGMIDQIIPAILGAIAKANGQDRWETWTIDGLKFAKWTDKKTMLEFATGGYVRVAGLSARDLSESGADKILSPSWFHIMLEEISELDYETIEKVITRLRYDVTLVPTHEARDGKALTDGERAMFEGKVKALGLKYDVQIREGKTHKGVPTLRCNVLNVLMMCENPPSINHWSYKHFFEHKNENGTPLGKEVVKSMFCVQMNPQDNVENLGEQYIKNLRTRLTGANYERFYLGQFQDTEQGEILKRMNWTSQIPRPSQWQRLIIYTDPTPLTGKEHSKWADFKASVLLGLFDGNTYVLDIRVIKGSTLDMLQNVKQLWDASPRQDITEIVMEKKAVPSDFNQVLATFQSMTGWMCTFIKDTRVFGDKIGSIETFLQPLCENDMIYFDEKWRDTERGREAQVQWLKFSRKKNVFIHDDIPDAIMRGDTWMRGRKERRKRSDDIPLVGFVNPAFIQGLNGGIIRVS